MLNRLSIQNYALINSLDISFAEGLNIITGETGAGKSILLGALSLILGQRVESKYFFNQQKKCVIEGYFRIKQSGFEAFFDENEVDFDEETILRREISADGKSRAFINDTPVNLQLLKQLGEKLIDIHSQHATLEINDENFQRLVVDTVANNQNLRTEYSQLYKAYRKKITELKTLNESSSKARLDADYFQFQYDELDNANLQPTEQELIESELNSQTHAEEIKRNLLEALYSLDTSDNSAVQQLKNSFTNLQQAEKFNPELSSLTERLRSVQIELKDIISEIAPIEQATFFNQQRAEELTERLNLIFTLQKKHHVLSVEELIELKAQLNDKLANLSHSDETIKKLTAEIEKDKSSLVKLALTISSSREKAIPEVEKKIIESLQKIGMPNTKLVIENNALSEIDFNFNGIDQLRFLFSANNGQAPAPMNKVASGGELSRLMLSIKSLIAKNTTLPTIIFDEIDTGISGETALKVGRAMEDLAKNMQVIAITHLPQIAGRGKSHYQVYKDENGAITQTGIKILNEDERVFELAKMLSGNKPSEFALQNAKELLKQQP